MTGDPVADGVLLVVLVLAVVLSVGLLVSGRDGALGYLGGRESELAHVLMNAVMAWMLTPLFTGGAGTLVVVLFGVTAAVFAGLLVLGFAGPGHWRERRPASAYHLVASLAMVYATVRMTGTGSAHHGHDMPGMDMSGMDMSGMDMAPPVSGPAWVLAVLFALDAVGTAIVVAAAPDTVLARAAAPGQAAPGPEPGLRRRLRVAAVPHVVMDVAMVVMLLGPHRA